MSFEWVAYANNETGKGFAALTVVVLLLIATLTYLFYSRFIMAEATAAHGQMKDLKVSEVKKSKKDGAPQKAAKKSQQPKKKVRRIARRVVSDRMRH
jgi:mannitol-specific phosphotransferase system IIBC component